MSESFKTWDDIENVNSNSQNLTNSIVILNSENNYTELELFDNTIKFEDNFKDGKKERFIILPIYQTDIDKTVNYTPLLNAGGKIIIPKNFKNNGKTIIDKYLIVDYEPIFGLRWKMFKRYSTKFNSDERLIYELLLIKYRHYGYKEFFLSFNTILLELGVKETRAKSVIKKFEKLGIITRKVKIEKYKNNPSQVTYYTLVPNKILDIQEQIIKSEFLSEVQSELNTYLKPIIK